ITQARTVAEAGQGDSVVIVSVPGFGQMRDDAVTPMQGRFPPADGDVVVERLALEALGLEMGDRLVADIGHGAIRTLTIAGGVHDAQQMVPEITGVTFGYVTPGTMGALGELEQFSEIRLRIDGDGDDRRQVQDVLDRVEKQIENSGRPVLD